MQCDQFTLGADGVEETPLNIFKELCLTSDKDKSSYNISYLHNAQVSLI